MTFDFERHSPASSAHEDNEPQATDSCFPVVNTLDTLKRDRFELLSAYLDSEVNATERRQVEEWLATDPTVQRLYTRLLTLRQGLQTFPTPAPQLPEQVAVGVFDQLNRRQWRTRLAWAGTAAAALVIGALTGLLPGERTFLPQFAQSPAPVAEPESRSAATNITPTQSSPDALMIALDRPVVEIPKAPVSAPESSLRNIHQDSSDNIR